MATSTPRLRQGLHRGRSPREELISLRRILARVAIDERQVIKRARDAGMSWDEIGSHLHMTGSGVRRRYLGREEENGTTR